MTSWTKDSMHCCQQINMSTHRTKIQNCGNQVSLCKPQKSQDHTWWSIIMGMSNTGTASSLDLPEESWLDLTSILMATTQTIPNSTPHSPNTKMKTTKNTQLPAQTKPHDTHQSSTLFRQNNKTSIEIKPLKQTKKKKKKRVLFQVFHWNTGWTKDY